MKKLLVFLFIGLTLSIVTSANPPGVKTDLKPGIEMLQGQPDATIYVTIAAESAIVYQVADESPAGNRYDKLFTEADRAFRGSFPDISKQLMLTKAELESVIPITTLPQTKFLSRQGDRCYRVKGYEFYYWNPGSSTSRKFLIIDKF
jgi:hypothetical protein